MKHTVIYKCGEITVTREMTQPQLAELLLEADVTLISVNAPKISGKRKSQKKGR